MSNLRLLPPGKSPLASHAHVTHSASSTRAPLGKKSLALLLSFVLVGPAFAQAVDICDEVEQVRQGSIESQQAEVDKEFDAMEEVRQAMRECQVHINAQMAAWINSGGMLGDILNNAAKELSPAACDEIKKQAEAAARKVEQEARKAEAELTKKVNEATPDWVSSAASYGDKYASQIGANQSSIPDPSTLSQSGSSQSGSSSVWDSLGKMLW